MNKYTFPLLAIILAAPYAMANDNLTKIAPYPTAEKDMHRYVIQLAKKKMKIILWWNWLLVNPCW